MTVQTNQIQVIANPAALEKDIERIQPRLEKIVPTNFPIDRFKFAVLEAARKSKSNSIWKCTVQSTLGAMLTCAELGLMPNTTQQHAFLVPFWNSTLGQNEMGFQIGYRGLIELAFRYKVAKKVWAECVYGADAFDYMMGTEQYIKHVPDFTAPRNEESMVAVYAVIETEYGTQFTIMAKSEIDTIRDQASQAAKYKGTPWDLWYTEMAKKTVLKRLMKTIAVSPEIAMANDVDGKAEAGEAVNFELPGQRAMAARIASTNDVDALLAGKIPVASQDAPQPPDDQEPTNVPPTPEPPKVDPAPAAPVAKSKALTLADKPEYMKGLHAVAAEHGWKHEDISTYMKELGFASTADFPFDTAKYKAVLDHIKANPFQKPTPPTEPTPEPPKPSTMDEPAPDKELDKQIDSMKKPAKKAVDKMNTLHNFPVQFGKLISVAGTTKWGYNRLSTYIMETYGVDNPRDIDLNQAAEVMKTMEANVGGGNK